MSTPSRSIYLLDPRKLRPEVIAVAFAKTSRSPETFHAIAAELADDSAAQFHEKWVVGYGHSSIAEHAVLHLAVENVSRLAIESLQSNRLASYTEKSSRYQVFDGPGKDKTFPTTANASLSCCDSFYTPPEIAASRHAELYRQTCCKLFDTYHECAEPLRKVILADYPRRENESDQAYENRTRSKWMDHLRFLLPTATLANVGMTANARVLEQAIKKMLSHPLPEVRAMGAEIKQVAQAEVPTLVKYAERSSYVEQISDCADYRPPTADREPTTNDQRPPLSTLHSPLSTFHLLDYDREGETKFIAACLYRWGNVGFAEALEQARQLSDKDKAGIIARALGERGPFDVPLRELEYVTMLFDCVMDQGAYYEVKRHRMMTQTPQAFTPDLGYAVPLPFEQAGLAAAFCEAVEAASVAYRALAQDFPAQAAYVLTNAHNRRALLAMNMREAFHFCRLRSAPNAHFSIRRIASQIFKAISAVYPNLAQAMQCSNCLPPEQIEREYFARVS